ncbi:hypothetical protein [Calothrix sp. PCC 7507]|uniref:hypothetical protein n=1 Tax=Calothrix sp. PCC 7507 TaxID=99598 RepID=UPI0002F92003|nr:hypothetical protein [Calothrix sp. PCC 7507]
MDKWLELDTTTSRWVKKPSRCDWALVRYIPQAIYRSNLYSALSVRSHLDQISGNI